MPFGDSSRLEMLRSELLKHLDVPVLDLDFVAALAGDRPLTSAECGQLDVFRTRRGAAFFADLLFALTHCYFAYEVAEIFWQQILAHKTALSQRLKRNVGISVAALDFLQNVECCLERPALVPQKRMADLSGLAIRDSLTGLYDHSFFRARLSGEIHRYARYGTEVSLIMLDIDDFKKLNDTHGHQAGDRVLCTISELMQKAVRDVDMVARYGGEEFAVILSRAGITEALNTGERIRSQIAHSLSASAVTVSLGIAVCPHHATDTTGLVRCADQALYHSKCAGKNRISTYQPVEKANLSGSAADLTHEDA